MSDNFKTCELFLDFKNKGDFYFLQIIKRKTENPDMPKGQRTIKNFFITSRKYYWEHEQEIKELCINNRARAYLRLNARNYENIALRTLEKITCNVASKNYKIYNSYEQACGLFHSETDKRWIIDIDNRDNVDIAKLQVRVVDLLSQSHGTIKCFIDTPNGTHLITNPFNLMEFKKEFPNIDVHKDNPTILYAI